MHQPQNKKLVGDEPPSNVNAAGLERCETRSVNPERVVEVCEKLPDGATIEAVARTFRVLGEPSRASIVLALLEAGEMCVCDLAAVVGLSEAATSQHLRVLRSENTVRSRRDGRIVNYALEDHHVRSLMSIAVDHLGHMDARPTAIG